MTWILRFLLVVLPIAALAYWLWLRKTHADDKDMLRSQEKRLLLISGGLLVVSIGLMFLSASDGGQPGDFYIPPHEKDGKIVSGRFITQEEAKALGLIKETERPDTSAPDDTLETFGDN